MCFRKHRAAAEMCRSLTAYTLYIVLYFIEKDEYNLPPSAKFAWDQLIFYFTGWTCSAAAVPHLSLWESFEANMRVQIFLPFKNVKLWGGGGNQHFSSPQHMGYKIFMTIWGNKMVEWLKNS